MEKKRSIIGLMGSLLINNILYIIYVHKYIYGSLFLYINEL